MIEGTPIGVDDQEVSKQPRLTLGVIFHQETQPRSLQERIGMAKALIVAGMLEMLEVREEIEGATKYLDFALGGLDVNDNAHDVSPQTQVEVLEHPEDERFGTLMQRYRVLGNISQVMLAEKSGVNILTIGRIEAPIKQNFIRYRTLDKIFTAFGWEEDDPRRLQVLSSRAKEAGEPVGSQERYIPQKRERVIKQKNEQEIRDKEVLWGEIEALRNQGFSINKIAERLGKRGKQIEYALKQMAKAGRIQKLTNRPTESRFQEELALFDTQVKVLRADGLTYSQMAQRLTEQRGTPVSENNIAKALRRLALNGEIELRPYRAYLQGEENL